MLLVTAVEEPAFAEVVFENALLVAAVDDTFVILTVPVWLEAPAAFDKAVFAPPFVCGLTTATLAKVFVLVAGACSLPLLTQLLLAAAVLDIVPAVVVLLLEILSFYAACTAVYFLLPTRMVR